MLGAELLDLRGEGAEGVVVGAQSLRQNNTLTTTQGANGFSSSSNTRASGSPRMCATAASKVAT